MTGMSAADVELLRQAWAAFARGDTEAATKVLDPDVRWYGADDEEQEGGCHSREEALAFIRRSLVDGVTAELLDIRDAGEHIVVIIQSHTPPEWGEQRDPHGEVVTVRNGMVVEMVVHPTVDDALAAVGQPS
jgi:ketosteroid isomerase-like protein